MILWRFNFNRLAVLAAGVLGMAGTAAQADTVVLANGDRLTGQVLLLDAGRLVLQTDYAGELHIKWDQVTRLETDDPLALRGAGLPKDYQARLVPSRRAGKVIPIPPGEPLPPQVGVADTDGEPPVSPRAVDLAEIERIVRPHPFLQDWMFTGTLDVALDATTSTSRNQNWSGAATVSARRDMWRHGLRLNYLRKTQNGAVGTHNYAAGYTVDRFLSPKLFLQGRVQLERDHVKDPAKRFIVGAGPGYQFWDNELGSLSVSGLLTHTRYRYHDGEHESFPSVGMGWNFQRYFWGKRWQAFSLGEAYRGISGGSNYSLNAELGLRYSVTQWMSLYTKTSYNRVSTARQGTTREWRYSLGLGVNW